MRTIVVGDLHLKETSVLPLVDEALARHGAGRVVLCGDYCDDWGASDATALGELAFLAFWVGERRAAGTGVDLVVGNHDFAYLRGIPGCGTHERLIPQIRELLLGLGPLVATTVGDVLVTHAGVTHRWADEWLELGEAPSDGDLPGLVRQELEAAYADRGAWGALDSAGRARGGWGLPGPLWADASELARDPLPGLRQIVGHTPLPTCTRISEEPEVWGCDTFSTRRGGAPLGDGSALLVDEGGEVVPVEVREARDDAAE